MKAKLLVTAVTVLMSSTTFAIQSSVEKASVSCVVTQMRQKTDAEPSLRKVENNYDVTKYLSNDKSELTTIWLDTLYRVNGEEFDVSDSNGTENVKITKKSDTESTMEVKQVVEFIEEDKTATREETITISNVKLILETENVKSEIYETVSINGASEAGRYLVTETKLSSTKKIKESILLAPYEYSAGKILSSHKICTYEITK